jgi:hypothetical protein
MPGGLFQNIKISGLTPLMNTANIFFYEDVRANAPWDSRVESCGELDVVHQSPGRQNRPGGVGDAGFAAF